MIFRDLHLENSNHHREYFRRGVFYPFRVEHRSEEERRGFAQKWIAGIATVSDWVNAGPGEVAAAGLKLTQQQAEVVQRRRMQLYDWWLEYTVQDGFMRKLKEVKRYAPHQVQAYAQLELNQLENYLSGKIADDHLFLYKMETFPGFELDHKKILSSMAAGYMHIDDIWDPAHFQWGEAILRFKDYLRRIAAEGLEEKPDDVNWDELPYGRLWQSILTLSQNLTVQYCSKLREPEDEWFGNFEITGVSGSEWPYYLRRRLQAVFEVGFDDFLVKLASMKYEEQWSTLEFLKNGVEGLRGAIVEEIFIREKSEHRTRMEIPYKRLSVLKYQGDNDLHFVFNRNARTLMDFRLSEYVQEWEEGINIIVRKIEHALNNLNLISVFAEKAFYDVEKILDNTFVLISEAGAAQGTAFYLRNIGIVTCDHCVRKETNDPFYNDLIIHRGVDLKRQVKVNVIKSHPNLDIAILQLESDEDDFLGEGLEKGDSDTVKQMDPTLAAGFPNYNFGDSGITTEGKIIGVRTISGIQHLLVSNPLIEGNSGGPVLNKEGKVIGIVVTGADSFGTAPKTEKHGLVPINALDLLLW